MQGMALSLAIILRLPFRKRIPYLLSSTTSQHAIVNGEDGEYNGLQGTAARARLVIGARGLAGSPTTSDQQFRKRNPRLTPEQVRQDGWHIKCLSTLPRCSAKGDFHMSFRQHMVRGVGLPTVADHAQ